MRQAAAALVMSRALAPIGETMSRTPALPEQRAPEPPARPRGSWRRALAPSAWKPTHARS
jgi:hypothetical protein